MTRRPSESKAAAATAASRRRRGARRYPEPISVATTATMKANRSRDTGPEQAIRSWLHRKGFRFRKDRRIDLGGRHTRPDVVFATARVAVFVDGCFWHGCPRHGTQPRHNRWYWKPKIVGNKERDRRATRALRRLGWTVLRFWEHTDAEVAAVRVAECLRARG